MIELVIGNDFVKVTAYGIEKCYVKGKINIKDIRTSDNLSAKEAATLLSISDAVFRNLVSRGDIPGGFISDGVTKYKIDALKEFKESLI